MGLYNQTGKKVRVQLVGLDGNAFSILGRVTQKMRRDNWTTEEIDQYTKQATSGDYDKLLQVTMDYVIDSPEDEEDV